MTKANQAVSTAKINEQRSSQAKTVACAEINTSTGRAAALPQSHADAPPTEAEYIAVCNRHAANVTALRANPGKGLIAAYEETREFLDEWCPVTMAEASALCRAALAEKPIPPTMDGPEAYWFRLIAEVLVALPDSQSPPRSIGQDDPTNDTIRPALTASIGLSTASFSPDAELIALAQEITDLTIRERGLYGEGAAAALFIKNDKRREVLTVPIGRHISKNIDQLLNLRATTPSGLLARAKMTDFYRPGWRSEDSVCCDEKLAAGLLSDVLAVLDGQPLADPAATKRPEELDAELIRLCSEHPGLRKASEASNGNMDEADAPWMAYQHALDAIHAAKPLTMAGMVAKACVAKDEARNPDGTEAFENSPAGTMAWELVHDLMRMHGVSA